MLTPSSRNPFGSFAAPSVDTVSDSSNGHLLLTRCRRCEKPMLRLAAAMAKGDVRRIALIAGAVTLTGLAGCIYSDAALDLEATEPFRPLGDGYWRICRNG